MQDVFLSRPMPRGPLRAIAALVIAIVVTVVAVRWSGMQIREPDAQAVAQRSLRFADRPDGGVSIIDARSGLVVDTVQGEAGFLRGAMRALARERMRRGFGSEQAFDLIARADGRLTLSDPTTGQRLDLESFGPTNAATFARLLASR